MVGTPIYVHRTLSSSEIDVIAWEPISSSDRGRGGSFGAAPARIWRHAGHKDYLIWQLEDEEKEREIKKKVPGKCIKDYVDDPRLKDAVEMAAWLGA